MDLKGMEEYLCNYEMINATLFWSPKPKYDWDQSIRIERQLWRLKEGVGFEHLHYVWHKHSFEGLAQFFANYPDASLYLQPIEDLIADPHSS